MSRHTTSSPGNSPDDLLSTAVPESRAAAGNTVVFQTRDGGEMQGPVLRLARHAVTFEFCNPAVELRASEVLDKFKVSIDGRLIYSGRAVVANLVDAGARMVCEAKLDTPGSETDFFLLSSGTSSDAEQAYSRFFRQWQKHYRIAQEFKVLVTDIQSFLVATRQWLEQIEFDQSLRPDGDRPERKLEMLTTIAPRIIAAFNVQHERFEELAYAIPEEHYGAHQEFVRRQWQHLFLCSPFGQRTFYKPLGYAGDYEMMNMIHRHQPEGGSLYEMLIHYLLVSQWPAQSVRNRIAHLKLRLQDEIARVARSGRRARILNVGCGPAREVQDFLSETTLGNEADFVLVDFNEETLAHAGSRIRQSQNRFAPRATIETRQVSVHHLLRQHARPGRTAGEPGYDLIYCAGLFDYLSEPTCRSLVSLFYNWLRPGGVVVVANMNDSKPFRNFIEFVLDWQLIYRDSARMQALAPATAGDNARVIAEATSVNLFLHLRKPEDPS